MALTLFRRLVATYYYFITRLPANANTSAKSPELILWAFLIHLDHSLTFFRIGSSSHYLHHPDQQYPRKTIICHNSHQIIDGCNKRTGGYRRIHVYFVENDRH